MSLVQDTRFGIRSLVRSPGFALTAIAALGLGIGANVAIFSVLDAVLLRPLPYEKPHELVHLWESNPTKGWVHAQAAPANFLDWREQCESFQDIAASGGINNATWFASSGPERVRVLAVTGNYLTLLGAKPYLGRLFVEQETWQQDQLTAVASYSFWRGRMGGSPDAVGRVLRTDQGLVKLVGVLPPDFRLPDGREPQLWRATNWDPNVFGKAVWTRRAHWLSPIARLAPGVSLEQARSELEAVAARLEQQYPETNTLMGAGLTPLHQWTVADAGRPLWILMAAVGALLAIACANVANLLLARSSARAHEFAVRKAIGAGGWRVARQSLAESLVLSTAGALVGLALAKIGIATLSATAMARGLPRIAEVGIDLRTLAFAVAVCMFSAVLFGMAPAWTANRGELADSLHQGGRLGSAVGAGFGLRKVLVAAEVALSLMLVIAAGLLFRSLLELKSVDAGINPENVLTFNLSLPSGKYDTSTKVADFYEGLSKRLEGLPGVVAAGATRGLPLTASTWSADATIEGRDEYIPEFRYRSVTPGYFAAVGTRLVAGRPILESDDAQGPRVALINETFARHFEGRDPIGARIKVGKPQDQAPWLEVVGIVADEKYQSLNETTPPQIYRPLRQRLDRFMAVAVRVEGDPEDFAGVVRAEVASADPELAVFDLSSMSRIVSETLVRQRFMMLLVGLFAATALALAALGIYGVLAYSVSRRTREFGIRLALGARGSDVTTMVVRQGMTVVAIGLAVGVVGALALSRLIAGLLFRTSASDPVTYAFVGSFLALVALGACCLPAMRAARIDPQETLRAD